MNSTKKFQKVIVTLVFFVLAFSIGYYVGQRGFDIRVKTDTPSITVENKTPPDQNVDFGLFWDVWEMVSTQHINRPIDAQQMVYGAIKGMVDAIDDPYTSFLPPSENEAMLSALNGTYEGIGAELDIRDGQLLIVAPLDGSPAKAAGIQPGDKILKIEEESTVGISITEAVSKIRGEAGTISSLTISREGREEPFVVRIKRGQISIDSVTWEDKGEGIAYIRISRFGGDTNDQWDKVAAQVNTQMPQINAIIVDVRGNPGGYLQSAVHIAGEFMRDKVVAIEENATGNQTPLRTSRLGNFNGVPVIVLIDGGSASASEILAGALRVQNEATLVGTQSFGKGSIQDARDFPDGSGVHITVAKWLLPNEEWIHEVGITPDVVVEFTDEDIENEQDVQLDRAIEVAQEL